MTTTDRSPRRDLTTGSAHVLVGRMTLVAALVNARDDRPVMLLFAVATALLWPNPRALGHPAPWLVLAAVLGGAQFRDWWLLDDHVVATTYWLLALGLSRLAHDPDRVRRTAARLLVGAVFLLAFGWKLLSSQYVSGEFFHYTLLRDDRFEPAAVLVGGADADDLDGARLEVTGFTSTAPPDEAIVVGTGPRVGLFADVLTWYGLALEGAIAAAFLLPLRGRWVVARPLTLGLFCFTTYLVVPVVGFALLLTALGAAETTEARWRGVYLGLAVFAFVWGAVVATLVL